MVAEDTSLNQTYSQEGVQYTGVGQGNPVLRSRQANHAVFTKFEDTASLGTYTCTKNIKINSVTIDSEFSHCSSVLVEKDKSKLVCLIGRGFIKTVYIDIFAYPP